MASKHNHPNPEGESMTTQRKAPARRRAAARQLARAKRDKLALVRQAARDDGTPLGIMTRLARDPHLTVDKFAQLVAINREMMAATARAEYWAAYDRMAPEIPTITKRGKVLNKAGAVQSHYAKFEDIQRIIKPIIRQHGFTLSYRTVWPEGIGPVAEVIATLRHTGGHAEESRFRSPADASGGKNAVQGLGSANSYGKRYTVKDLLNIIEDGVDDDGGKAGAAEPKPPAAKTGDVVDHGAPPRDSHHSASKEPITEGQLKRLYAIAKNSGRLNADIKAWLKASYGLDRAEKIRRCDYDQIVASIESPRDLPKREPGQEG